MFDQLDLEVVIRVLSRRKKSNDMVELCSLNNYASGRKLSLDLCELNLRFWRPVWRELEMNCCYCRSGRGRNEGMLIVRHVVSNVRSPMFSYQ